MLIRVQFVVLRLIGARLDKTHASGFPTKWFLNKPVQLQGLARKLIFQSLKCSCLELCQMLLLPGRVTQSVTRLTTDASLTAYPGVASSI